MNNAEAKTDREQALTDLDIAFENNEITVREYRMSESEIDAKYPD